VIIENTALLWGDANFAAGELYHNGDQWREMVNSSALWANSYLWANSTVEPD